MMRDPPAVQPLILDERPQASSTLTTPKLSRPQKRRRRMQTLAAASASLPSASFGPASASAHFARLESKLDEVLSLLSTACTTSSAATPTRSSLLRAEAPAFTPSFGLPYFDELLNVPDLQNTPDFLNEPDLLDEPGVQNEPDLQQNAPDLLPGDQNKPDLQNEHGVQNESDLQNEPDLRSEPDLLNESGVQTESDLQNEPDLRSEPDLLNELGVQNESDLQNEPDLRSEPDLQNEPGGHGWMDKNPAEIEAKLKELEGIVVVTTEVCERLLSRAESCPDDARTVALAKDAFRREQQAKERLADFAKRTQRLMAPKHSHPCRRSGRSKSRT